MNFKHALVLSTFAAVSFLTAEELTDEPLYYEDYLKSLEQQPTAQKTVKEAPPAVTEEPAVQEIAVEELVETPEQEFVYYEDYLETLEDQYEQAHSTDKVAAHPSRTEEIVAEREPGYDSAVAQAYASSLPNSEIDMPKLSEAFGNFLGKNLKNSGIDFNIDALMTGIRNGINDKPSPLTESEYEAMMVAVQQQAFEKLSGDNLKKADAFMSSNGEESEVIELVPGRLQYKVLEVGYGTIVEEGNTPLINYTGKFIDGTVFSSSEETGGAITIPLAHTIPGFQKGITGMREGEKRRLFVHPDQGYGAAAGHLPPNSLLIFDIEVVSANHEDDEDDVDVDEVENDGDEDDEEDED